MEIVGYILGMLGALSFTWGFMWLTYRPDDIKLYYATIGGIVFMIIGSALIP